jgi:hypothetical protein
MVFVMAIEEACPHKQRPAQGLHSLKKLRRGLENNSTQPVSLTIKRQRQSLKLSFLWGLMKGELLVLIMMSENQ